MRFLARLYRGELPVSERTRETVKRMLVYSPETVTGEHLEGPVALHAAVDELQALDLL